jgi:hypothetical protein
MKQILIVLVLVGFAFAAQTMPDARVYKLSATKAGELLVHCANGADATIRPVDEFGSIIVSCGK